MKTRPKPNDNSVIIKLVTKTNRGELKWYIENDNPNVTIYKTSHKITKTKAISYRIYYRKNKPLNTNMSISMEYRKFYDSGSIRGIDSKVIRKIRTASSLILLLNKVLINMGENVIRSVVALISNEDKLLLVKRHDHDRTIPNVWVLPGGKVEEDEKDDETLLREVGEETGLKPTQYKLANYKSIIKIGENYYLIKVYVVNAFRGELIDYPIDEIENGRWVNKDDIFNYYIGEETTRIISYYINEYN